MYVRWRTLFGLGTAFWICACLFDYYCVDPKTKFYYSDSGEYDWLAHVADEEIYLENTKPIREDDIKFPSEDDYYGSSLVVWNIVAFFTTFAVCYISKLSFNYIMQAKERYFNATRVATQNLDHDANPVKAKISCSRIPVLQSSKSEDQDEKQRDKMMDSCASLLSNSSTSVDLTIRSSKSEMCSRAEQQMERQCSKLRDEMIVLQANSLKEHAALSRKLESVSREKRDLCRQLTTAQKENRAAKQQLEELLSEKSLLVKRLECASREFKSNTKSKKSALAKLEESQTTIQALRQELDQVTYEKIVLENKLKILDAEHENVKERLGKFEPPPQDSFNSIKVQSLEPKKGICESPKGVKQTEYFEISESQKDVQKVQIRLLNLEKSLDRLKLANWGKSEEDKSPQLSPKSSLKKRQTPRTDDSEQLSLSSSLSNHIVAPLENQVNKQLEKLLARTDNLTDEQRRKILDPIESSGENSSGSKSFHNLIEMHNEDPFERVGSLLNYIRRSPSPKVDRFNVSFSDLPYNETSTSPNDDDDTDDWEPPRSRIVSNSPAFQKFLKTMDPADRTSKNLATTTHLIF